MYFGWHAIEFSQISIKQYRVAADDKICLVIVPVDKLSACIMAALLFMASPARVQVSLSLFLP